MAHLRLSDQRRKPRAFVRDRRTLRIVLVVSRDIGGGIDDARKIGHESLAPLDGCSL
jgi:hypothetical protein